MSTPVASYRSKITVDYHLRDLGPATVEDIKAAVEKGLNTSLSSYLKARLEHEDAVMRVHVKIEKENDQFKGAFHFTWPSGKFDYSRDGYDNPLSLVGNAFKRCHEHMADEKR